MSVNIKVKVSATEAPPIAEQSFKSRSVKELWESVKDQLDPKTPFCLRSHSSGSYEAYSYLIPYLAKFIAQRGHEALTELWRLISGIPIDILDFALSAKIPSNILPSLQPTIYASYLMSLRMGGARSPQIALLHGSRELARLAMQHSSMSLFRDLKSANALLTEMLISSFVSTYGMDEASLTNVDPQHLVGAAIGLCYGKRQFYEGMSEGALMAFPAQEMMRILHGEQYDNNEESLWRKKWVSGKGKLFNNRMLALKSDPIWCRISRFGKPYPPFDFNSCMGVFDVGRRECIKLGLVNNKKSRLHTASPKPIVDGHKDGGCFKPLFISGLAVVALIYSACRFGLISKSILNILK